MSIQKPFGISLQGITIDANVANEFRWNVSGSIQSSFSIEVRNNSDNSQVWSLPRTTSYSNKYTIASETLENGVEYKIRITVWNDQGDNATSDYVVFQTSSRPIVHISPFDIIASPSYTFDAYYSQNEFVPLKSWIAILYDGKKNRLSDTGIKTDRTLKFDVKNLKSEASYYVEFQVTSNKGLVGTTGLIQFNVLYTRPQVNVNLVAENVPDIAGIRLKWNPVQVIGKKTDCATFIDNEKIDLRGEGCKTWFDDGFSVKNGDFTIKMWIEDIYKLTSNSPIVKGETYIIRSVSPPSDTDAIWIYDPNQLEEVIIGAIANEFAPIDTNTLWIEDEGKSNMSLTPFISNYRPDRKYLWIDTTNTDTTPKREDYFLLKLFGVNGEIKMWYEDRRFHVTKNVSGIISHFTSNIVTGMRFFVVLKQIDSNIDVYAENY